MWFLLTIQLEPGAFVGIFLGISLASGVIAYLFGGRRTSGLKSETLQLRERLDEEKASALRLDTEFRVLKQEAAALQAKHAEIHARLETERRAAAEKQALLEQAELRLSDTFKALSSDALKASNEQFLQLAKESLATQQVQATDELEKRRRSFEQLAKPIEENLLKVQTSIGEIEKSRGEAYVELKTQIAFMNDSQLRLQRETSQLVKALRQPTGRGQWGELQLHKVVEMAGMQEHCDFTTQSSFQDDEGRRLRPDMIVNLPGGKTIVIDAKTPMDAYLAAIESEDDAARDAELFRHTSQIKTHISQLSSKRYTEQFSSSPEFIVLFLPSEAFFSAALQIDPGLIEHGVEKGVILSTPTTLIALLRAVAYGWRQEALEQNAREIADLGRELHKRLFTMAAHFSKIGKALGQATQHYNSALGSFETRVLSTARRFETLRASDPDSRMPDLAPVETSPREPLLAEP